QCVLALLNSVFTTDFLKLAGLYELKCRYWPVCVAFLYTLVMKFVSVIVICTSRKAIELFTLFSIVNCKPFTVLFKDIRRFCSCPSLITAKISSTYRFQKQRELVCLRIKSFSKSSITNSATTPDSGDPIATPH